MAERDGLRSVEITFTSPGACPPVYVASSFTSPEWQPQELEYFLDGEDEPPACNQPKYVFFKRFNIPPGRYPYKFRLGDGDWWVCDQKVEIVTDDLGNQNNLLNTEVSQSTTLAAKSDKVGSNTLSQEHSTHPRPLSSSQESADDDPMRQKMSFNDRPQISHSHTDQDNKDLDSEDLSQIRSRRISEDTTQVPDDFHVPEHDTPSIRKIFDEGPRRRGVQDNDPSTTQPRPSSSPAPPENLWERIFSWLSKIWFALFGRKNE